MNRTLFISAVIIVLLVGCRQQENAGQLKSINECLQHANAIVQYTNLLTYEEMIERQKDPVTSSRAEIWMPRATQVQKSVDSITGPMERY